MARREKTKKTESRGRVAAEEPGDGGLRFTKWTGIFAAAGVAFAAAGFFLLSQGSINLAPVLLLVGFLVFFPLAVVR